MPMGHSKCWNCGSAKYHNSVSVEQCPDCGIRCDYHGGGANKAYDDASNRRHASEERAREEDNRRWWQENHPDDWQKYT